ncbi:MAG: helix-turn-helix domain-containing protein [Sedimenticola sp.]|uniref:Helix-turn-helix transcriptional regulator n=1 Tax=Sedimenticola thiotaurini TaxID=1543721 RepID=A0A558CWX1_9GAMM|nr:helix-turn-helix domain-containing protein [Sedimenticola sp.]TVT53259.1 MAG: helix-turn-helix transcriptional regulator [Sedimenticola thiotaurini]MCW8920211.1 helix-turn-helix domain-containing protein [Sedimenticola sp.]MCW8946521.1 helix-turn-helix domain-containing protein [Sedimenticola sp.]MCW8974332.1 helix-turn-helix domain-containing protein [Sedimenticola sp.]
MILNDDFSTSSSEAIAAVLCRRLEAIRLSKNISQTALAKQAGVSRSTMTRIADGQSISLDSFIRVAKALGLAEHLAVLLPNPEVRPVELVRHEGQQRRRASGKRKTAEPWSWGDEENGS